MIRIVKKMKTQHFFHTFLSTRTPPKVKLREVWATCNCYRLVKRLVKWTSSVRKKVKQMGTRRKKKNKWETVENKLVRYCKHPEKPANKWLNIFHRPRLARLCGGARLCAVLPRAALGRGGAAALHLVAQAWRETGSVKRGALNGERNWLKLTELFEVHNF